MAPRMKAIGQGTPRGLVPLGLLLLAGASSTACDDERSSFPPASTTDCERACWALEGCDEGATDDGICVAACEQAVAAYGAAGEAAIAECADCLVDATCAELADGSCSSACHGGLVSQPHLPGTDCQAVWQDDGHTYQVDCTYDEYDGNYDCDCYVDALDSGGRFESLDFCTVADLVQLDQANRGCGWQVAVRESCSQDYVFQDQAYWVSCGGTALGWQCACSDAAYPPREFFSDTFCALDVVSRIDVTNAECGFGLDGTVPCETTWVPDTTPYTVRCDLGQCQCFVSGAPTGASFASATFCVLSHEDRRVQANAGCGWAL